MWSSVNCSGSRSRCGGNGSFEGFGRFRFIPIPPCDPDGFGRGPWPWESGGVQCPPGGLFPPVMRQAARGNGFVSDLIVILLAFGVVRL